MYEYHRMNEYQRKVAEEEDFQLRRISDKEPRDAAYKEKL